ncbi:hypothetical protein [Actinophytocola sp.]|uniref:hypothetical protein n=1 Tax=Actinophytocola sp. TaxID=1872138 RepID=UPI003899D72D
MTSPEQASAERRVPPPDDAAHLDGLLMHELSAVNYHLGQYVLRYYDADAGRGDPVSVADEQALIDSMTAAAEAIRARVERRKRQEDERR